MSCINDHTMNFILLALNMPTCSVSTPIRISMQQFNIIVIITCIIILPLI